MTINWREVTATVRPPQNKYLLWCTYYAMREDDSSLSWRDDGIREGIYRFGSVEVPGGSFSLPSRGIPKPFTRTFWAEVPNYPHDDGLIREWRRE